MEPDTNSPTVVDYHEFSKRLTSLNCYVPNEGLAILPINLDSAQSVEYLKSASTASTIKTLLRQKGIPFEEVTGSKTKLPQVHNNSFEWISPTLLFTAAMLANYPHLTDIVLGVIANYATDFLKGNGSAPKAKLEIVIENKKGQYKRVSYEGDPQGIDKLGDVVRSLGND
jgi:hypothetical protein